MAFTLISLAFLAVPALTSPLGLPRQTGLSPGAAAVNDNILGWQDDIANVNGFLKTAAAGLLSAAQLEQSAADLLLNQPGTAQDEPNRLMALAGLISATDATAYGAATRLMTIFGGLLTNLTEIVNAGGDLGIMDKINTLWYLTTIALLGCDEMAC